MPKDEDILQLVRFYSFCILFICFKAGPGKFFFCTLFVLILNYNKFDCGKMCVLTMCHTVKQLLIKSTSAQNILLVVCF